MSSENPKLAEIRHSVEDSYRQITQTINEKLVKLNPDRLYQAPAENEWSLMQNLAHIREIMPYWGDEVAKLVKQPGQKFGRVMNDENRLRFIEDHGRDTLAEALAALPASYAHLQAVLTGLTDADLTKTGVHSRYGEKPLEWFIKEFITDHLKNHVTQLNECLAAVA
jgi:uncharacterized damage-inducible protein DinB